MIVVDQEPAVRVIGIDHVVYVVRDAERSVEWYRATLGAAVERLEEWRKGDAPFPSVRVSPDTIIDLVEGEATGTNVDHVALTVESIDLGELAESGRVDAEGAPRPLSGARGIGTGLYIRDPDGNRIELRTYP